tara:strand:+ start:173 stop:610 length:438 start_codon:yes stop_codon:yes gene_type:complete
MPRYSKKTRKTKKTAKPKKGGKINWKKVGKSIKSGYKFVKKNTTKKKMKQYRKTMKDVGKGFEVVGAGATLAGAPEIGAPLIAFGAGSRVVAKELGGGIKGGGIKGGGIGGGGIRGGRMRKKIIGIHSQPHARFYGAELRKHRAI